MNPTKMAKRDSSPGISPAKKRIRYRSGSDFNADYTRTFDWVMASDRGKQQAYCKVCSEHFSISHGGIDDVRRHGEGKKHLKRIFKKNHGFSARFPAFFFRNLTCLLHLICYLVNWTFCGCMEHSADPDQISLLEAS